MANLQFSVSTPSGGVAVASDGNHHTILAVAAPSNQRVKITHVSFYFKGVTPTDTPIQVRVLRQTKATGTSGGTVTPANTNAVSESIQSSATYGYTAEPTAGVILFEDFVQPQLGSGITFPISEEFICPGGGQIGVEVTILAGNANTCNATILCEE